MASPASPPKRPRARRSVSLAEDVALALRRQIQDGTLAPGQQLPTEARLTELYGVSRPIVREAISRLRTDGLVNTRQGVGAFVVDNPRASSFRLILPDDPDSAMEEIEQIAELMMVVEVGATELAARRRNDADVARIRQAYEAMNQALIEGKSGVDEDLAFHAAIVAATHNRHYVALADHLERSARRLIRTARTNSARHTGLAEQAHGEHTAIVEAICVGDPDAAA